MKYLLLILVSVCIKSYGIEVPSEQDIEILEEQMIKQAKDNNQPLYLTYILVARELLAHKKYNYSKKYYEKSLKHFNDLVPLEVYVNLITLNKIEGNSKEVKNILKKVSEVEHKYKNDSFYKKYLYYKLKESEKHSSKALSEIQVNLLKKSQYLNYLKSHDFELSLKRQEYENAYTFLNNEVFSTLMYREQLIFLILNLKLKKNKTITQMTCKSNSRRKAYNIEKLCLDVIKGDLLALKRHKESIRNNYPLISQLL